MMMTDALCSACCAINSGAQGHLRRPSRAHGNAEEGLDAVERTQLDFDQPHVCAVTLQTHAVYMCLVCGQYLAGRRPATPAYTHAQAEGHHIFMCLDSSRIYRLPEDRLVESVSLVDIQSQLCPNFTADDIKSLWTNKRMATSQHGHSYVPGTMGLQRVGSSDYISVVLQALFHVPMFRDVFLVNESFKTARSVVVREFGCLMRRVWHRRNVQHVITPANFILAVMEASERRFGTAVQDDPLSFLVWLMRELKKGWELGVVDRKMGASSAGGRAASETQVPVGKRKHVVDACFKGCLIVEVDESHTGSNCGDP